MTKICSACGRAKAADQFGVRAANRDGLQGQCKACRSARMSEWVRENPDRARAIHRTFRFRHADKIRESNKRDRIRRDYGLSLEAYDAILARGCAICGATDKPLGLDHDHATGKNRDALCHPCNQALGLFYDDPERLRRAASYLEHHRSEQPAWTREAA